jgi:1-deoxy-D-xylulose-5-phosphate synthase
MASILDTIDSPVDLKNLSLNDLKILAGDLREVIIATCAANGGHLAPSLGVVELTIAMHRVFNSPQDKIVWDVGHQAYAHKLLTRRRDRLPRSESPEVSADFPSARSRLTIFLIPGIRLLPSRLHLVLPRRAT